MTASTRAEIAVARGDGRSNARRGDQPGIHTPTGRLREIEPPARLTVVRSRFSLSTPARLRAASVLAALVVALATGVAVRALGERHTAAVELRDNASVLAADTRGVASALVDADAAATAAFLNTGGEDTAERRRYEDAMRRATGLTTSAAALADRSHTPLVADLGESVNDYNAIVSRARGDRIDHGQPGYERLATASAYRTGSVDPIVADLQTVAAASVSEATAGATGEFGELFFAVLAALAALIGVAVLIARASHRIVNLAIAAGVVLVLGMTVAVGAAGSHVAGLLESDAASATASTDAISEIRATAVRLQTERNAQTLTGFNPSLNTDVTLALADRDLTSDDTAAARKGTVNFSGDLATMVEQARTPNERALAAEAMIRWQRYVDIVRAIPSGPVTAETQSATLTANRAFVGFNVALDAMLDQVQLRYRAILDAAARTTGRMPWLVAATGVVAIVLLAAGAQMRIDEYR